MARLLIIGNGFDLSHGLETRYDHFVKAVLMDKENNNEVHNELVKFHTGGHYTLEALKENLKNGSRITQYTGVNGFFNLLIEDTTLRNWYDIERLYFNELMKIARNNETRKIARLNLEFGFVKPHLKNT